MTDDQIIDMGYNICDVITEAKAAGDPPGETMLMLTMMAIDAFDPAEMGAYVVGTGLGAAPQAFCLEHEGYVDEMLEFGEDF